MAEVISHRYMSARRLVRLLQKAQEQAECKQLAANRYWYARHGRKAEDGFVLHSDNLRGNLSQIYDREPEGIIERHVASRMRRIESEPDEAETFLDDGEGA